MADQKGTPTISGQSSAPSQSQITADVVSAFKTQFEASVRDAMKAQKVLSDFDRSSYNVIASVVGPSLAHGYAAASAKALENLKENDRIRDSYAGKYRTARVTWTAEIASSDKGAAAQIRSYLGEAMRKFGTKNGEVWGQHMALMSTFDET